MFSLPSKPTAQTLKVPGRIDEGAGWDGELAQALPQLIGLIRDDIMEIVGIPHNSTHLVQNGYAFVHEFLKTIFLD